MHISVRVFLPVLVHAHSTTSPCLVCCMILRALEKVQSSNDLIGIIKIKEYCAICAFIEGNWIKEQDMIYAQGKIASRT